MDTLTREYTNEELKKQTFDSKRLSNISNLYDSALHGGNYSEVIKSQKQQQFIDLEFEFDLSNPFSKVKDMEKIRKGILNYFMQGNRQIDKLDLTIKTDLTENQIYQNLNFHLLFGVYFFKDISKINILIKDKSGTLQDNREIFMSIIDFMVFKSKVNISINNRFIFQIHPGEKETSIVTSFDMLSSSNSETDESSLLRHFLNHSYSIISADFNSLQKYKLSITKTFSSDSECLISSVIEIKDYLKEKEGLISLFSFFSSKFKFLSIELKINDENIELLLTDLQKYLKKFLYIIISFKVDIHNNAELPNNAHLLKRKIKIPLLEENSLLERFSCIQQKLSFLKLTLCHHIHTKVLNEESKLLDCINLYQYVYYNRKLMDKCVIILFTLSKNKITKKFKQKKPIVITLLGFCFGEDFSRKFYIKGVENYSSEVVKNKQIVTY